MHEGKRTLQQKILEAWNPYLAGGLTGLLIVGSVALSGAYFGVSSSFTRFAGLIERTFSLERFAGIH